MSSPWSRLAAINAYLARRLRRHTVGLRQLLRGEPALDPLRAASATLNVNAIRCLVNRRVLCFGVEESFFSSEPNMIRDPDLDVPRLPGKKGRRVHHDWRQPAAHVAERVIDQLEWQLEFARDDLVKNLHRTTKRLGCSHYFDTREDPLSIVFSAYDVKIDQALRAFRRALGLPALAPDAGDS